MMQRLARGGSELVKRLLRDMEASSIHAVLIYPEDGPLDGGGYDDLNRDTRNPELTKDLSGWEPSGKPFSR